MKPAYRILTSQGIWTLDLDVVLYAVNGSFFKSGQAEVKTYLSTGALQNTIAFTDIEVTEGKVSSMRLANTAATATLIAYPGTVNPKPIVWNSTASAFEFKFGLTAEQIIAQMTLATGATANVKRIISETNRPVVTGELAHNYTYRLFVTPESSIATQIANYTLTVIPGFNTISLAASQLNTDGTMKLTSGVPTQDTSLAGSPIIAIDNTAKTVTVVGDAEPADLVARLYNNTGSAYYPYSTSTIAITNSEEVTKTNTVFNTGDKVIVTALGGAKQVYSIIVSDSDRVIKANSVISYETSSSVNLQVNWGTTIQAMLAALELTDGTEFDYELEVNTGTQSVPVFVEYSEYLAEEDEPVTDVKVLKSTMNNAFRLTVEAQDGIPQVYYVNAKPSTSLAFEVKVGSTHLVTAIDHTAKTINVQNGASITDLTGALKSVDGSVQGYTVVSQSGSANVFTGDKLTVTSASGATTQYIIALNPQLSTSTLELKANANVVQVSGSTLFVKPQIPQLTLNSGANYSTTSLATIISNLDFMKNRQDYRTYTTTAWTAAQATFNPKVASTIPANSSPDANLENNVVVVISQDKNSYQVYSIDVTDNNTTFVPTIIEDPVYVKSVQVTTQPVVGTPGAGTITAWQQPFGELAATPALIAAELNFVDAFMRYSTATTITVTSQSGLSVVYTIVYDKAADTTLSLKSTTNFVPAYVESLGVGNIVYKPQFVSGSSYVTLNLYNLVSYYATDFEIFSYYTPTVRLVYQKTDGTYVAITTAVNSDATLDSFATTNSIDATEKAALKNLTSNRIFVEVVAQNTTTKAYYPVSVGALKTSTVLAAKANLTPIFEVQGTIIYVGANTTITAMKANLDVATNWQTVTYLLNSGNAIATDATVLVDYNVIRVVAQDGTIAEYTVRVVSPNTVAAKVASTAANSLQVASITIPGTTWPASIDVTNWKTNSDSTKVYLTAAEFLALLDTTGSRSYSLTTSEGLAKTSTQLFTGDILTVTTLGIDGHEYTNDYIIVIK